MLLEAFGADPDSSGIEEKDLEQIAPAIGEDVEVARQSRLAELMRDEGMQPTETAAQIRDAGRQPDPCVAPEGEHVADGGRGSTQGLDQPAEPNRVEA